MRQTVLVTLLGVLTLASVANGAEYYVSPFGSDSNSGTSSLSPFLTMNKALSASSRGDTINAASGYYTGSDNVGLTISDRTIVGASTSGTVFQTNSGTVFTVSGTTYLRNFTLTGIGTVSTGISMSSNAVSTLESVNFSSLEQAITLGALVKNLTMSDCYLADTVAEGIYYFSGGSTVSWENVIIETTTFNTKAYAIHISCGDCDNLSQFTVTDCLFSSSRVYIDWYDGADLTLFQGCDFANITSTGNGGAVSIEARSAFAFDDCVFSNCAAYGSGGAIYFKDATTTKHSSMSVTNCRFTGNVASSSGAGMYILGTPLSVSGSVFALNNATGYSTSGKAHGGAIYASPDYNTRASCNIESSIFIGNVASSDGGALNVDFGSGQPASSVSNSIFVFNTGGIEGGAITTGSGTYSFSASSFIGNSAPSGGALNIGSSATVSGSALSFIGNTASSGGGVEIGNDATFTVSGASFSGNVAKQNGGGISMGVATLSQ